MVFFLSWSGEPHTLAPLPLQMLLKFPGSENVGKHVYPGGIFASARVYFSKAFTTAGRKTLYMKIKLGRPNFFYFEHQNELSVALCRCPRVHRNISFP